jgi:hypothetical protein
VIFDLFKKKLNIREHFNLINHLIVTESELQWKFHTECNFSKDGFRSISWSKNVLKITANNMKMSIDDELSSLIVDLGFRRVKELIDEYWALEKSEKKLTDDKLNEKAALTLNLHHLNLSRASALGNKIKSKPIIDDSLYSEIKSGYELQCQIARYSRTYSNLLLYKFKKNEELANKFLKKGKDLLNNLDKKTLNRKLKDFENEIVTLINKRNPNNLLRYKDS